MVFSVHEAGRGVGMDRVWMASAIDLARKSVARGDGGPFGAIVVKDGEIVGWGWNRVITDCDPTAHAEISAIRDAATRLQAYHLHGCALYTTCEPCPMCLSAAYWARIQQICYAATEQDAVRLGFADRYIRHQLIVRREERELAMVQMMRSEALAVFTEWEHSELKRLY